MTCNSRVSPRQCRHSEASCHWHSPHNATHLRADRSIPDSRHGMTPGSYHNTPVCRLPTRTVPTDSYQYRLLTKLQAHAGWKAEHFTHITSFTLWHSCNSRSNRTFSGHSIHSHHSSATLPPWASTTSALATTEVC